jgi:hypothetical protein
MGVAMNHIFTFKFKAFVLILLASISSLILGCSGDQAVTLGSANVPLEIGNQLGDIMATIDEAGRGNTNIVNYKPTLDRYNVSPKQMVAVENAFEILFPKAEAAACGAAQFSACSSNQVLRSFNSCTIGGYTLNGSTLMTWTGGSGCTLSGLSQSIRITPSYTVSGNNMTLTSTNTGTYGSTLTWASGSGTTRVMNYTSDGISRTLRYNGTTLLDIDTRTNSPITVTGSARANRVLSSSPGALEGVNNTTSESCTFQPSGVTWAANNCNCATSGSWVGTCSSLGTFQMTITGCGLAAIYYTQSGTSKQQAISLDRCVQN